VLFSSGSLNYDITFRVDHFAPPKSIIKRITSYLGGSGGNAAVAAAKILGKGRVIFLGCVGSDEIGNKHISYLKSVGVLTNLVKIIKGTNSGQAFVAIREDGETAVYSYYGANSYLTPDLVNSEVIKAIKSSDALLIANPPVLTAEKLVRFGKKNGKLVFWDPGSLSPVIRDKLDNFIRNVDYLMPNLNELMALTNSRSVNRSIQLLEKSNPKLKVIVKEGEKGATLYDLKEMRMIHVPSIHPEELGLKTVSSVGCGDAFSGVFAALKLKDWDDSKALIAASCAASINLAYEGPRNSPTLMELLKYLPKCEKLMDNIAESSINL